MVGRVVHAPDLGFCPNSVNFRARFGALKFVVGHFRGRESTSLEEYIVPVCLNITKLHLWEELQPVEVGKKITKFLQIWWKILQKSTRKCAEYIQHKNYFHAETLPEARSRSFPVKLTTVSSFTRLGGPYTVSKQVMWWFGTMVGPNSVQTVDLVSSFCWSRGKLCEFFFLSKKSFFL